MTIMCEVDHLAFIGDSSGDDKLQGHLVDLEPILVKLKSVKLESCYFLRPIILFANTDVSRHVLVIDTSILAKCNMGRRFSRLVHVAACNLVPYFCVGR
jgi:hypothetical protein